MLQKSKAALFRKIGPLCNSIWKKKFCTKRIVHRMKSEKLDNFPLYCEILSSHKSYPFSSLFKGVGTHTRYYQKIFKVMMLCTVLDLVDSEFHT